MRRVGMRRVARNSDFLFSDVSWRLTKFQRLFRAREVNFKGNIRWLSSSSLCRKMPQGLLISTYQEESSISELLVAWLLLLRKISHSHVQIDFVYW